MRVENEEAISSGDEEYETTYGMRLGENYDQPTSMIGPTRDSNPDMDPLADDEGYRIDGDELPVDQAQHSEDEHDEQSITVNYRVSSLGLISTSSSSLRKQTYTEATSMAAGSPVHGQVAPHELSRLRAVQQLLESTEEDEIYLPFQSGEDYGLSQWFMDSKVSKGQINSFLRNPFTNPPSTTTIDDGYQQPRFSYANAKEWQYKVDQIPHGIEDDQWQSRDLRIRSDIDGVPSIKCVVYCRNILNILRFLLGHQAFIHDLTYAPTRVFNLKGERVYTEMHTGDWWWTTQEKIQEGGTVVPILLASDKTLMTNHHGDSSMWPVYITIGNLNTSTRRSQVRPAIILLGLIPVVKMSSAGGFPKKVSSEIYHTAMNVMLEPLKTLTEPGIDIRCADNCLRRCHPVIAGMIADYPEQVLITGVKSGQHCPICLVPPKEREHMTRRWPLRTHEYTKQRIRTQIENGRSNDKEMDVHAVSNFAWDHALVNIHSIMMVDILHQLLKGVVMTLIKWIQCLIEDVIPTSRKRNSQRRTISQATAAFQLDDRFAQIPSFGGLKTFPHFSTVTQWTGDEQKAIMRQLVAVITPLLYERVPAAIQCTRAILDFVMLALYTSQDEATLSYMRQAIERINDFKHVFEKYRPMATAPQAENDAEKEHHFNIPKLHMITHYEDFIRLYGSARCFDSCYDEAAHKFLLKEFYKRTNKNKGFETQILKHNIRWVQTKAMADLLSFRSSQRPTSTEAVPDVYITQPTAAKNLFDRFEHGVDLKSIAQYGLNANTWRPVTTIAAMDDFDSRDFIDALAVFVRENRKRLDGVTRSSASAIRRERDPTWVGASYVSIRESVACWVPDGKDGNNTERLTKLTVRCAPNWRNSGRWRRDHVWIQNDPANDDQAEKANEEAGREIGQLMLIISVADTERLDGRRPSVYTGAFVERLQWRNGCEVDPIHGMFEVEHIPLSKAHRPRDLGNRRFYDIRHILRSAHVIPTGRDNKAFYVNNFVDWDQYNTIFSEDFMGEGLRAASAFQGKRKGDGTARMS